VGFLELQKEHLTQIIIQALPLLRLQMSGKFKFMPWAEVAGVALLRVQPLAAEEVAADFLAGQLIYLEPSL